MSPVIQADGLQKSYGSVAAVQGLSLTVPPQSVYAFLGPNGAGKTTTIRLILGLQHPDRGSVTMFGLPLATDRMAILRRTGSMVEAPAMYAHLTGRENLEVQRRLLNLERGKIDDVLKTVDLAAAADRPVRGYSTGMRQRLGIARALLSDPELLVLDEPTNGLDPSGIHEIRGLIRDLPKSRGVTVFVSSHLLSEMEQVATHFAIVAKGRLRFEGSQEDIERRFPASLSIEVDQPERAQEVLKSMGVEARCLDRELSVALPGELTAAQLNKALVDVGIAVSSLMRRRATLESLFLELTQGTE
jgi:ABC-type multidrug transport system ATPase subunit